MTNSSKTNFETRQLHCGNDDKKRLYSVSAHKILRHSACDCALCECATNRKCIIIVTDIAEKYRFRNETEIIEAGKTFLSFFSQS